MTARLPLAVLFGMLALAGARAASASDLAGRVVDAVTGEPVADATVTVGMTAVQADGEGRFRLEGGADKLRARAPGYARTEVPLPAGPSDLKVALKPFTPKALYLSVYGIGSAALRGAALQLIEEQHLNALVIDVKGDAGLVAFRSAVPLASAVGAQKVITIRDLRGLLSELHQRGLYAIARIVVSKDDRLAAAHPELAVKRPDGTVYRDREGARWVDPASKAVRDYDVAIAAEAAEAGFDEIQFDYLRFPDSKEIRQMPSNTEAGRVKAIGAFIDAARAALVSHNVFLAIDVFGYTCWNLDDTGIGQRIEDILPRVDYLSPMLYPSGFQFGIPGYTDPVAHPYEIVRHSLDRALARTHVSPRRLRPWLQAFKDYAFDRRVFGPQEIAGQIKAAEDFGTDGWMLWNPRNVYSAQGLDGRSEASSSPASSSSRGRGR